MRSVRNYDSPIKKSLYDMELNDVFNYPSLGKVAFKRWKRGRKSFEAVQLSTNKNYSCRCTVATAETLYDVTGMYIKDPIKNDVDSLHPGDLFVIPQRKDAVLLRFIEYTRSGKVFAENPLDTSQKFTVDRTFTFTKIENLK